MHVHTCNVSVTYVVHQIFFNTFLIYIYLRDTTNYSISPDYLKLKQVIKLIIKHDDDGDKIKLTIKHKISSDKLKFQYMDASHFLSIF